MTIVDRRNFLASLGASACVTAAARLGIQAPPETPKPDVTLQISPVKLEIAPGKIVETIGYNGSVPGPLLRFREGQSVSIQVENHTSNPELVHWHGLHIPSQVDGAMEEGTPVVPAHGSREYSFIARPSGTRWYHAHGMAGRDLKRSTYTGQFGFFYIEPKNNPAQYDAEVFLALHGWNGYLGSGGDDDATLDVIYKNFSINSHSLGYGDPIRVREGQHVIFRIVNASATYQHSISLSGHKFTVVALDGNPVPNPREVEILELGPAERVDAVVTMNQPGVWILGEVDEYVRHAGLGVVIEYANQTGEPKWVAPARAEWDYAIFGNAPDHLASSSAKSENTEVVPLVFKKKFAGNRWVDYWTVNGKSFPKTDPIIVQANKRYRLKFDNQSDEAHPIHLHRHSFELRTFARTATSGVMKDVVVIPANRIVEAELVANNPGPTLFHCHQQLHMDYGFMTLIQYKEWT
ncbi:MAG TPA: multicopper oxidase domain-containing protein [Candidatus Acidoferrales bacterium]